MSKKSKSDKERNPDQFHVNINHGEENAKTIAEIALRPTVQAAVTIQEYGNSFGKLDLTNLVELLVEQTQFSIDGDLRRAEAMLTTQAHTLDAIFNNLAKRAITAEYLNKLETYLKLGLRAQSQCRSTWEALSAIKNPPVAGYVRQANIAHGPQQVNNGPLDEMPRARENENLQSKQLEQNDGERLDTGTTGKAGEADPAMAAVGEINGTED